MKLNKSRNRRGIYIRTPAIRESIRQARLGTRASLETCQKHRIIGKQLAGDPLWRKKVSEATIRAMRRPKTKELHRSAVSKARRNGVEFEKQLAEILPRAYEPQFYVRVPGMRRGYTLDFALPLQKIAIECDGPSHGTFKQREKDLLKTHRLHMLGWKVIRVPYGSV